MSSYFFGTTPNSGKPKTPLPTFNFGTPSGAPAAFATTGAMPTHQGFRNAAPATCLPTQAAPAVTAVPTSGGFPQAPIMSQPTWTGFNAAQPAAAPTNAPPALACFGQPAASTTSLYEQPSSENTSSANSSQEPSTSSSLNSATTTSKSEWFGQSAMNLSEPFRGLGGVDISASLSSVGETEEYVQVKQSQVPHEITETVDSLKDYINTQRALSSDMGRTTTKLNTVTDKLDHLYFTLQAMSHSVETNYNDTKLLRTEAFKAIQAAAMAQRTHDMPAGLQFENTTPLEYFQSLVTKYEQDITAFQQQISFAESRMRELTNPTDIVDPEDLKCGLTQLNEIFIAVAGRVQEIHQSVEEQKELYLKLREYRLNDTTNVFAHLDNPEKEGAPSRITSGPSPFH